MISIDQDQVYEIKFHGNPVSKLPLKYSKIEKISEKRIIKKIFFSANFPTINIVKPKKIDKKRGIRTTVSGIKDLKFSS